MNVALRSGEILLPSPEVDLTKWAVVACDQFTAQRDYWDAAEAVVGDSPSALRIMLPEIDLNESEARIPHIQETMARYLAEGVLAPAVSDGFVLLRRSTASGDRWGLMALMDLEMYDYAPTSRSLIRPTEGTIESRVPPRARIRRDAALEMPHVMMLIDDPDRTVIEPLADMAASLRPLYDFDCMLEGGRLSGWAVEGSDADQAIRALDALCRASDGLLYAVGDGNHSLAAARKCWTDVRDDLSPEQRETHPARWAMVELVNLNCPALAFEPIHRVLYGVRPEELLRDFEAYLEDSGGMAEPGCDLKAVWKGGYRFYGFDEHPLRQLQAFLDQWLSRHPEASIDYIHGDDALNDVASRDGCMGFMPRPFEKEELFPFIRQFGPLPRKTFSMGEAREKRYYLECRRIKP